MQRVRVLLADDHRPTLSRIRQLLEPEFEVVGVVEDGQSLLEAAERLQPDVQVIDISMPVLNGIEAARRILKRDPAAKLVFLTIHRDPVILHEALASGALGYVIKPRAAEELATAIREASQGRRYLSSLVRE